jgi:hypothetical protein
MATKENYRGEARSDAKDTAENFLDEILEQLMDGGKASDDLFNDYPNGDGYHHESHTDRDYNLQDAAQLLDDLSDYEETDYGLWQGLEPRRAIAAQAAYTYRNAVLSFFSDLIKEINEDGDVADILAEMGPLEDKVQEELDELEEEAKEEGVEFTPPFDPDDEAERRKEALQKRLKTQVEALIEGW